MALRNLKEREHHKYLAELHSLVKSPRRYSSLWSKEPPMDGEVIIAHLIDSAETYIRDWKYAVTYDNNPDKVSPCFSQGSASCCYSQMSH